jgi:hypothetical protein
MTAASASLPGVQKRVSVNKIDMFVNPPRPIVVQ